MKNQQLCPCIDHLDLFSWPVALYLAWRWGTVYYFSAVWPLSVLLQKKIVQMILPGRFIHEQGVLHRFDPQTHLLAHAMTERFFEQECASSPLIRLLADITGNEIIVKAVKARLLARIHQTMLNIYQIRYIPIPDRARPVFLFSNSIFPRYFINSSTIEQESVMAGFYQRYLIVSEYMLRTIFLFLFPAFILKSFWDRGICLYPQVKKTMPYVGEIHSLRTDFLPIYGFMVDGKRIKNCDYTVIDNNRKAEAQGKKVAEEFGFSYLHYHQVKAPIFLVLENIIGPLLRGIFRLMWGTLNSDSFLSLTFCSVLYHFMEDQIFFSQYRTKRYISWRCYGFAHIIKTIVINSYGGKTAYYMHGNLPCAFSIYFYIHADFLGVLGRSTIEMHQNYWGDEIKPIIMGDYQLEIMQKRYCSKEAKQNLENKIRNINGSRLPENYFLISAFDNYYYPEGGRTKDLFYDYYEVLESLCRRFDNVFVILKLITIHEVLLDYFKKKQPHSRFYITYDHDFSTPELIPQSNLVLAGWWSTIGIQALSVRTPALYYLGGGGENKYPYERCHPYDKYNSILVSRTPAVFEQRIVNYITKNSYIEESLWAKIVNEQGLFIEQNGLARFRNQISRRVSV